MHSLNVVYKKDFFKNHIELYNLIYNTVVWDERMLSRRTASFGVAYNYSGISYPDTLMPNFLVSIAEQVRPLSSHSFNNCLINDYPDGNSTMGFHSDSIQELVPNTYIAIISLGSTRILTFRSKVDPAHRVEIPLEPGSVLLMPQSTQLEWKHALLAASNVGPRISITFRQMKIS